MDTDKKKGRYQRLFKQIKELMPKGNTLLSRMATINAILYHKFEHYFWCGFYLLDEDKLNVGPYQGPVACQELEKNIGVCWASINEKNTIIVHNVLEFPGHISCDSRTRSEIVLPLRNKEGDIIGVFDVDCKEPGAFDEIDSTELEKIIALVFI